ncbi:hypothetical protein BLOT_000334 [Blomia tropicalis]|nr:hypothetical protein BLOT_000334 [Blomia tropicalis]
MLQTITIESFVSYPPYAVMFCNDPSRMSSHLIKRCMSTVFMSHLTQLSHFTISSGEHCGFTSSSGIV